MLLHSTSNREIGNVMHAVFPNLCKSICDCVFASNREIRNSGSDWGLSWIGKSGNTYPPKGGGMFPFPIPDSDTTPRRCSR